MKKIGLKGYLYDYDSMDYNSIDVGDTVDIHKIWINVWIYQKNVYYAAIF